MNGNRAVPERGERGVSRSSDRPRPFLDLEATDNSGRERRPSSETHQQEAESALDSLLSEEIAVGLKSFVNKEGSRRTALSQEAVMSAPWFVVGFALFTEVLLV